MRYRFLPMKFDLRRDAYITLYSKSREALLF